MRVVVGYVTDMTADGTAQDNLVRAGFIVANEGSRSI